MRLPLWYRGMSWLIGSFLAWRGSERTGPWTFQEGTRVWIHAASLGECKAAIAVASRLPHDFGAVLTSTTWAGLERLRTELPDRPSFLAPFDSPRTVRAFVESHGIVRQLLVEAEVWPGWVATLSAMGIPMGIVTVRVSGASLGRWKRLWRLFPWIPGRFAKVWANAGEQARAHEAGFLQAQPGAGLKWAGRVPKEVPVIPGRHAALSLHRKDHRELAAFVAQEGGGWLLFPRRLRDVEFWSRWAARQGLCLVEDPAQLKAGEAWIARGFGRVAQCVPGCEKAWVSPGHDTWEPLFLGVQEVHPFRKGRDRLEAYRARTQACLAEVVDWLRSP